MNSVDIKFRFEWSECGEVRLDASGMLVFPRTSSSPGLYKFNFHSDAGSAVYIGETVQLDRRFQHYRTPGNSQKTNLRLNKDIREALNNGSTVTASILTEIDEAELMLSRKHDRVLLEHGALLCARRDGAEVLNS